MTEREALIVLNMSSSVGPVRAKELSSVLGSFAAILEAPRNTLSSISGVGAKLADEIASWQNDAQARLDAELALVERARVEIITVEDPGYPSKLKEIHDAPLALYVRGSLQALELPAPTLGVVGTRRPTRYGSNMAERLSTAASHAGWPVVSGLAYGIDAIAHAAVVDAKGAAIAVLGGGLARIHPQDHIPLAKRIIETGGAVVSEFPMEKTPNKRTFPMRNRIISGLSDGVLVVEAGLGSGSLITANFALEQGRSVFSVPGRAEDPQAMGTNKLLKDGAALVESFDDILAEFEFLPGMANAETKAAVEPTLDIARLEGNEKTVAEFLEVSGESSADQIIAGTGISAGDALAALMGLKLRKIVSEASGKRFALKK